MGVGSGITRVDHTATHLALPVDGVEYELGVATWGDGSVGAVFVHDGLGSIGQWRDVPARSAAALRSRTLAYDRAGHGTSTPVPTGAWPSDWMHREAVVLAALIEAVADEPVRLIGHSDGATIALLCAAERPDLVTGVVSLAAHSWVEDKCVDAIRALRADPDNLVASLSRYHARPAELFEAWSGAWTSSEFAAWDIRPRLTAVTAPTTVVQGEDDEYATDTMAIATWDAIGQNADLALVPACTHMIHRDHPDLVVRLASGQ